MDIIVASGNKGKIKEIEKFLPSYHIIPFKDILDELDIVEDGTTFKQNAIIKLETIRDALQKINYKNDYIIIADDSGISVPLLDNEPGIYSARYAGVDATDKQNNQKLIEELKSKNITQTDAFYTACIAIYYKNQIFTTHGWMYGSVIIQERGKNGFGYDPMFIPKNFDKTLGELEYKVKKDLSHRTKALKLAFNYCVPFL